MISGAKIKQFAGFRQQKKCKDENVFVVEGDKIAREALLSDIEIKAVCATGSWIDANRSLLAQRLSQYDIYEVSEEELKRIGNLQTPNSVWLLAEQPKEQSIKMAFGGLTLVLDHIQDPGNMGTILRIADWFGIRHVVCSNETVNYLNPKAIQASMGSIFRTQVHYTDLNDFLRMCQDKGITVYGATLDGGDVYQTQLQRDAVLVIGNESRGIETELEGLITQKIAIPNFGGTCESLNASVATGILCSEFRRRDKSL